MKKLSVFLVIVLVVGMGIGLLIWHVKKTERAAIKQVIDAKKSAREIANSEPLYYIVQSGDSLPKIARQMGITQISLMKANHVTGRIWVGQKLINPPAITAAVSDYISALEKIDPSGCPKKFRDAWLNYVQSWVLKEDSNFQQEIKIDEAPTKVEGHLNLSAVGGGIGSDVEKPNLHSATEMIEKLDSTETWQECKRVALDYGVFVL
jgi:LysM repeat protein